MKSKPYVNWVKIIGDEKTKGTEAAGTAEKGRGLVRKDSLGVARGLRTRSLTQSETGVAWQRLRVETHIGVGYITCREFMLYYHSPSPHPSPPPRKHVEKCVNEPDGIIGSR